MEARDDEGMLLIYELCVQLQLKQLLVDGELGKIGLISNFMPSPIFIIARLLTLSA